jgi:RecB family exonuclease
MEMMNTWSFSRLETFEKCPYQAYMKFVLKRPEPETRDRTPLERGIMVHEAAEQYIRGERADLIKELRHFDGLLTELREEYPEQKVIVEDDWAYDMEWQPTDWFGEHAWLRMKLDAGRWLDENQMRVHDWKTGRKDGNEVKHMQQGQLYAIGAFMRFPELDHIEVEFDYTDKNDTFKRSYSREKAMKFLPNWTERAKKATETTDFPARPNTINCRWCPYSPNNGGDSSCPWGVEV